MKKITFIDTFNEVYNNQNIIISNVISNFVMIVFAVNMIAEGRILVGISPFVISNTICLVGIFILFIIKKHFHKKENPELYN